VIGPAGTVSARLVLDDSDSDAMMTDNRESELSDGEDGSEGDLEDDENMYEAAYEEFEDGEDERQ
jgi:hypothetical protein